MAIGAILGQRSGVQTVNDIQPDINGNVKLTSENVGAMPVDEGMPKTGGTFSGNVNMNNNRIIGLPTPNQNGDAVPLGYVVDTVNLISTVGAGFHNCIYRGKNLGSSVTSEQYATIAAGEFNDLYIGDYWNINGVNWRIAAFDYYYNTGDSNFTKHHVVIVPDASLYYAKMNETNVTTGGYVGSAMYKTNLAQAKTTVKNTFGNSHVLTKRELLTNAVSENAPSGWSWFDSEVDLMSEVQVYGSIAWGAHDGNGYNVASGDGQFPLFRFDRRKLHIRQDYWLRDVVSASGFARVYSYGDAGHGDASNSLGVRPAFCIG